MIPPKLQCANCRSELLLNPNNPNNVQMYPLQAWFTCFKQTRGLTFPSLAVLQILTAVEALFREKVIGQQIEISIEKNLDLKLQFAVLQQIGPGVFNSSRSHFFDHPIGQEMDHLSALLRQIISTYLSLRLKTYGGKYSEMIVHRNESSLQHELTKTIIFRNQ